MRIGFTGTVSVGKTTLVKSLQEIPQFKDYTFATERSKYLRDLGIPLNTDSTIKGQMVFLAERASELICENIITDRTVLDVMAFTNLASSIRYDIKNEFEKLSSHLLPEYDYIFYISTEGTLIEDNGVRTINSEYRTNIDKEIQKLISIYKPRFKNFHTISGSNEERIKKIQQIINL